MNKGADISMSIAIENTPRITKEYHRFLDLSAALDGGGAGAFGGGCGSISFITFSSESITTVVRSQEGIPNTHPRT
jgi:hypothetical protein